MLPLNLTFCKPPSLFTVCVNPVMSGDYKYSCMLQQTSICLFKLYDLLLQQGIKRLIQKNLVFIRFPFPRPFKFKDV